MAQSHKSKYEKQKQISGSGASLNSGATEVTYDPVFGNFAFIVHGKACRRKLRLLPWEISKPLPTCHYQLDKPGDV